MKIAMKDAARTGLRFFVSKFKTRRKARLVGKTAAQICRKREHTQSFCPLRSGRSVEGFLREMTSNNTEQIARTIGKIIAKRSPVESSPPRASETSPTRVGPTVQPTSPPRERIANSAVPPLGMRPIARLNVAGQKMPTESPHNAQPTSPNAGTGESAASR